MRIRMRIPVSGVFHNLVEGVRVGDVVDVDDENGARYIKLGYAELADQRGKPERPPEAKEERAVTPNTAETAVTKPEVVEKPSEPVKRGPGRPRKD